jgi:hypothetical protein
MTGSRTAATVIVLLGLAGANIGGVSAQSPPTGLGTRWIGTTLSPTACLQRAEGVLRDSGFTIQMSGNDVAAGTLGAYTSQLMCPTGKGMVVFVVTGPNDHNQIDTFLNSFAGAFTR